jgi:hypothetical protein
VAHAGRWKQAHLLGFRVIEDHFEDPAWFSRGELLDRKHDIHRLTHRFAQEEERMRTISAVALVAALLASPALAVDPATKQAIKGRGAYGSAGCGLGSMAFGDQPGAVQVLAATTNGLFGTQTFGITTGTSNCGPGMMASGTRNLVETNRVALAKDAARGAGETIGALTVINRCEDSAAVGAALQSQFKGIFASEQATDEEVTQAILRTLHEDKSLGCGRS